MKRKVTTECRRKLHITFGLTAVLAFLLVSPEPELNKVNADQDKNKRLLDFHLPEQLLMVNKKMRIYSSASIAVNQC